MVSIKHKVTIKTKVTQDETLENTESPKTEPKLEPNPVSPTSQPDKKSNTGKVIGGLVAVAAIIAVIFFFINNKESEGSNDSTQTEVIAQNTENQKDGNEATAAASSNEDATAESEGVPASGSEAPVTENTDETPASTTPSATPTSANDNQMAGQPAKQNPATIAEPAKPAQSKPATTLSTKSSSVATAPLSGDVEENARRVIRGEFGNGQERKDKLGASYTEIQGKVNEMYRQGLVR